MPSTRSSTKSTQALERAYADPATLTEAIADRPLTKAEKLWAFQQLALREKYGPGQITVPLPKMGRISVGVYYGAEPLFVFAGPCEWHPNRVDSLILHDLVPGVPLIPDKHWVSERLCYSALSTIHAQAESKGRMEYLGDRELWGIIARVLDRAFGGLSGYVLTSLGEKYASNETFSCLSISMGLLALATGVPRSVLEDPSAGVLGGFFEIYCGMLLEWDREHYDNIARVEHWIAKIFNASVMPHLALDVDYLRSMEAKKTVCEGPAAYPSVPFPVGVRVLYRRVECRVPVDSAAAARLWLDMSVKYRGDWRYEGFGVASEMSYRGASVSQRQLLKKADGSWVPRKEAGQEKGINNAKSRKWNLFEPKEMARRQAKREFPVVMSAPPPNGPLPLLPAAINPKRPVDVVKTNTLRTKRKRHAAASDTANQSTDARPVRPLPGRATRLDEADSGTGRPRTIRQ